MEALLGVSVMFVVLLLIELECHHGHVGVPSDHVDSSLCLFGTALVMRHKRAYLAAAIDVVWVFALPSPCHIMESVVVVVWRGIRGLLTWRYTSQVEGLAGTLDKLMLELNMWDFDRSRLRASRCCQLSNYGVFHLCISCLKQPRGFHASAHLFNAYAINDCELIWVLDLSGCLESHSIVLSNVKSGFVKGSPRALVVTLLHQ